MVPNRRFARFAASLYKSGTEYALIQFEVRSGKSHRHYFATIKSGWMNLPELEGSQFKTPEHLRHRCLIEAGYSNEKTVVCDTKDDARRMGALAAEWNEYALVVVSGNVVKIYTAQSQAVSVMDNKTFHESKERVLEIIAAKIGITVDQLASNTWQHA